jgi:hypothetical protein
MCVRFKNNHRGVLFANVLVLLAEKRTANRDATATIIEESASPARMCALFFRVNPFFVIQTMKPAHLRQC